MKSSRLVRRTELRRSKYMAKSRQTKQAKRSGDAPWLSWIRTLPCSICNAAPPSHPHHSTGSGMGMKSRDRETMPLCFRHHRDFHDGNGIFDGWTRSERRIWQELQVERVLKASLLDPTAPRELPNAFATGQDRASLVEALHRDEG